MVTWSSCLYIGEGIGKRKKRIKRRIQQGKPTPGIFLIAEPSNRENLFDILDTTGFLFPYCRRHSLTIYGLAKGRAEAEELVVRMLEEVYRETGEFKVREYFLRE